MIHRESCKKFKFDHTSKWYMHKPESVLENGMHKVIWDFEIQTDHLSSARRPGLVIVNKKQQQQKNSGFWRFSWPQDKIEWKQKER